MSGSVTPARRTRDEGNEEEEDFEVSVDGESPPASNRSKRARLDDGDDESDEQEESEEEQDAPLLPDSFRRSPKGKGRALDGRSNGHAGPSRPKAHQPGSIVRVTLTDFVTYTKAEFNPGPNLNMVIGPNGTGKSTLVCAICIGLGWATKHLGRGKDLDEFVKHGAKKGQIEIELAADPKRHHSNPVITTRIKKGDKANAEYLIDGKKENKKRVQELARSFSIQVDNLCQFLPQDRVVEFSRLSPVELLSETQRAAAPQQMSDWHEQLKGWRKDQKQQQAEQQGLAESIKKLEDRQKNQEGDVQRLRERQETQNRLNALEKSRPLPEYRQAKENHGNARRRRKEAEKELEQLEHRMQPNFAAVTQKQQYLETIKEKTIPGRKNVVNRVEKTVEDARKAMSAASERLQECKDDIAADMNSTKGVKLSMTQLQRNVSNIKNALAKPPPEVDMAAMNVQSRELTRQIRELNPLIDETQHDVGSLGQQISQRKQVIQQAEQEKENLQSQAGQQMNRVQSFSRDAARAWEWIQSNRDRFQGEVYGPPLVECRVKDEKHASAVESMLQQSDVLAFTVTTKADFDMLSDQVYTTMRLRQVNIRTSNKDLDTYRTPVTAEALRQYGLEGWVLDLLEGPEPVLAMLCDNRNIHQTAYTFREVSQNQFDALQQSPISSWVTSKQSHIISRRREYGDKATSTRVNDLRPARFFTKISIDHQQDSVIERKIAETQSEIDELIQSRRAKMEENERSNARRSALVKEKEAVDQDKKVKQSALTQYNGLPVKLELAEGKLKEARQTLKSAAQRRREKEKRQDALALEKGQYAIDYANAVDSLRGKHLQQFEAEILEIEAQSDLDQLKAQHAQEEQLLNERRQEKAQLERREKELLAAGKRLQAHCNQVMGTLTPYEQDVWHELEEWNLDQFNTEVVSLTARLDSLIGGGNERTLHEYEDRVKLIEAKTRKFNELGAALDELEVQIADIRERWEPQLDALVEEISEAFAENFSTIQCAGEVGVHKDEDFEHWAIQIKVKFREDAPLSLLDAHRQSGGERAVSTIFYLMALQSLARAPFRVVDEINQGMDPRNERLVHSRMVDIACAELGAGRRGSQYFLITPKLLQGLKYHEDMKVHCIASGEHMPEDFREVDFGAAVRKTLELRGRSEGVAAG